MDNPHAQIFAILDTYTKASTYQEWPEKMADELESNPIIIYSVPNNTPEYTIDRGIGRQNVQVQIDIFAKQPAHSNAVLKDIELLMRNNDYLMSGGVIPLRDPDGYSHLVATFVY